MSKKIDLNQPINQYDGEQVISQDPNTGKKIKLTLGIAIRNALGSSGKGSGDAKLKKHKLGLKCVADKVEFSSSEIEMIKDAIEEVYPSTLILGRVVEILDPKSLEN